MKHCKYCEAELEEGSMVCPSCGKDNADVTQEVPEQETEAADSREEQKASEDAGAEQKEIQPEDTQEQENAGETETDAREPEQEIELPTAIQPVVKMTPGKVAAAVAGLVVLAAAVVALVLWGMKDSIFRKDTLMETLPDETGETVSAEEPTIPEDGDPDNETCKGSYSASDEAVIAARDTVVATAGEYILTLGELQIYYWQ